MKYSNRDRKIFVRLLKWAKEDLWDGVGEWSEKSSKYKTIGAAASSDASESNLLFRVLLDRLEGEFDVKSWLLNKAKVPEDQLTDQNVQAYRLRWIDELIREFSA